MRAAGLLRRLAARNHHRCQSTLVEQARALLRGVEDPLLGRDVIATDCVSIDQQADNLRVTLDVRTAAHPHAHKIAERCRDALEQLRGVEEITISLQANGFGRSIGRPAGLASVRSAVAVASCKGGVGKSTICTQTAFALASKGARVGVVDADVHGPSIPTQLNLEGAAMEPSPAGGRLVLPVEHRGVRFASFGFKRPHSNDEPTIAMRGPVAGAAARRLLNATDWGELDYLLVDLPPGIGDVTLAVAAEIAIDGAVVITTPSKLAQADVVKGLALHRELGIPTLAVVENFATVSCPECGKSHRPLGVGHAAELAALSASADEDLPGVFALPMDAALADANERGIVGEAPPHPSIDALASQIIQKVYAYQHAMVNRQLDVLYDKNVQRVVLRRFTEQGAAESFLKPQDVVAARRTGDVPADLSPTRVALVGNKSVVFDWSDRVRDDVYAVDDLLALAERLGGPGPGRAVRGTD